MRTYIELILAILTSLIYWQVVGHEFLSFDDTHYVTENPHVINEFNRESLVWAFTQSYASNWHPLTWLSHMLDFQLFGLNPSGHHLVNLLFHIFNTLLLFGVLIKMTGVIWRSALVALLFAVHPLNVESVAWIAERKNVLSTFFWFLTMWAYAVYVERNKVGPYLLTVLFLGLGLMSKPMLVTLPFVLMLLDIWPLNRFKIFPKDSASIKETITENFETISQIFFEKVPLFLLVIGSSVTTYIVQKKSGVMQFTEFRSSYSSIANALFSYVRYLGKVIWPRDLSVYYPHPGNSLSIWITLVCGLLLLGITLIVIKKFKPFPHLALGWFWYLGTLVPVIGIVQVGEQAMANRYMYIPSIGIFIALAWSLPVLENKGRKKIQIALVGSFTFFLMILTWIQVGYWKNGLTLFSHTILVTENKSPSFVVAYNNLGYALANKKKYQEAIPIFKKAIKINPTYSKAHNNLGYVFNELGRYDEAIDQFQTAISLEANYAEAYNNLANALRMKGLLEESLPYYQKAVRYADDYAEAYFNFGVALGMLQRPEEAIELYEKALQLKPNFVWAHNNIAGILFQLGNLEGAIEHYRKSIVVNPLFVKGYNNLGSALAEQGKLEEAIIYFEKAIAIDSSYTDARKNLRLARVLSEKAFQD